MKHYPNPNYNKRQWKIQWTSRTEIEQLLIAWVLVSLAFSFAIQIDGAGGFIYQFLISLIIVGTGFLLHELAHKFVAQSYGMWAEFRASYPMLGFALIISSLFGVVIAAPGAVMIFGHATRKQTGIISAAGPITNFLLSVGFFMGRALVVNNPIFAGILWYGFLINGWLGLFNLIPFAAFDGRKIINWNKLVYGCLVAIGFLMMIATIVQH